MPQWDPRTGTGAQITRGQYSFAQIPSVGIPRSVFDRSCGLKTAFDSGLLIPIFVDEALPGDTLSMRMTTFGRMQATTSVPLDNVYLEYFFFAVPNRLLWTNWEKFNGAQDDPGDSISFSVPQMTETPAEQSLSDYMGIPIGNSLTFNSLHHRAYNLIFNEWFRDQDLTDSAVVDVDDGPDTSGDYVLRRRAKRHDYFTSCRPATQKGTAVSLPLGTTAPVQSAGDGTPLFDVGGVTAVSLGHNQGKTGGSAQDVDWSTDPSSDDPTAIWNDPKLEADLSTATAATINDIRNAFQTQKVLEKDIRGGTRYTEIIRSHFGVVSPDQRLQRPEFLGGGGQRIVFNTVARTDGFVGAAASFGTTSQMGIGFHKSFTEHCVLVGLVNCRADLTYQQGLHRMFNRRTRYDYYLPSFAHLGEQAVLNKEIFADGSANDDLTFGYQERWAEYRYKPSTVTGRLRSDAATPLDTWHMALDFSTLPALNNTFIEDNPPMARITAVDNEPQIFLDAWFQYRCARPMPTYSVPGLIDHF